MINIVAEKLWTENDAIIKGEANKNIPKCKNKKIKWLLLILENSRRLIESKGQQRKFAQVNIEH